MDEVAGAEVAEARGGSAREALDEEVEAGGRPCGGLEPGRGRRGRDGEEDGVGRGGEAEGEELSGCGVGGEEPPVRGEVEGDVEERGVGGGRTDGGERRLGPLGRGLGRGWGRGDGGKRGGGEEAVVVWAEEVEAPRRGAQEHGGRPWGSRRSEGRSGSGRGCSVTRPRGQARQERGRGGEEGGREGAAAPAARISLASREAGEA